MTTDHHDVHDHVDTPEQPVDRRVVLRAAALLSALAATGKGINQLARPALAQTSEFPEILANRYVPGSDQNTFSAQSTDGWLTFTADFTFYALGASWAQSSGTDPQIEVELLALNGAWSNTYRLTAQTEDGGRPNRDDRIFTWLILCEGATQVRYRTLDASGAATQLDELSFCYIDGTAGPEEEDLGGFTAAEEDTRISPRIVSRHQWGANPDLMNWDPEYDPVTHVIIHHSATSNNVSNWGAVVRQIYHYHSVEQGWGDIGYNYIVSPTGTIYEGRYGGQDVVGGHAYQYAFGSAGICLLGDYSARTAPAAGLSALAAISAWVARDLDPLGTSDFHEIPDLPVISSHRDVVSSTCPGTQLWSSMGTLRTMIQEVLDEGSLNTNHPGGIVVGDRVTVITDDGANVNVRGSANGSVIGTVTEGTTGWVLNGPVSQSSGNWYEVQFPSVQGFVTSDFLIITPPAPPASDDTFPWGTNVRMALATSVKASPGTTSAGYGNAPAGTFGFVTGGPTEVSGSLWYLIAFPDNVIKDGWVPRSSMELLPVNENPSGASFQVPGNAVATRSTPVRVRPGPAQTIQGTATSGTRFRLTVDPVEIGGVIQYGAYGPFGGGWVDQRDIRLDSSSPVTGKFQVGDTVRTNSDVNLRTAATTSSSVIRLIPWNTNATVIGGPSSADGYIWYMVQTSSGQQGWSAQDFWDKTSGGSDPDPTPSPTPEPTDPPTGDGKFDNGDTVRVTESLRLRSSAGTGGSIIRTMSVGTTATVIGGPTTANGYTWWQLQTSSGSGWAAEDWLQKTGSSGDPDPTPTPPPSGSGKFDNGDTVRVTESLRLRSSAGIGGSIIRTMSVGTTATVIGGPTTANGYTWWQLQTSSGSGWAAEDWLQKTGSSGDPDPTPTPPPSGSGKFDNGDTVRVTESLRLRSSAGTGGSIIATMPAGTNARVIGGPTTTGGYTWWNLETAYGNGWAAENWLNESSGASPGPSGIAVGDTVRVFNGNLNLRSSGTTSASVLLVLPDGTQLSVIGGPTSANGYTWWQVQSSSYGTGWVAGDYLQKI